MKKQQQIQKQEQKKEQKTLEQIKQVIIDYKGCGKSEQRQEIIKLLEGSGLKVKRTSEIGK